ncbi:hypothetical protein [Listeria ivanovii]|nr:hypothetical protein [Listeria ivanovii]
MVRALDVEKEGVNSDTTPGSDLEISKQDRKMIVVMGYVIYF